MMRYLLQVAILAFQTFFWFVTFVGEKRLVCDEFCGKNCVTSSRPGLFNSSFLSCLYLIKVNLRF